MRAQSDFTMKPTRPHQLPVAVARARKSARLEFLRRVLLTGVVAVALLLAFTDNAHAESAPQWRCGWFESSGPQYATLTDRDGEWLISMPGGHAASGRWPPRFPASQWVRTGQNRYGYGCACMRVTVDDYENQIMRVLAAYSRPLAACRSNPMLHERGADAAIDSYDRFDRYERQDRPERINPFDDNDGFTRRR